MKDVTEFIPYVFQGKSESNLRYLACLVTCKKGLMVLEIIFTSPTCLGIVWLGLLPFYGMYVL